MMLVNHFEMKAKQKVMYNRLLSLAEELGTYPTVPCLEEHLINEHRDLDTQCNLEDGHISQSIYTCKDGKKFKITIGEEE